MKKYFFLSVIAFTCACSPGGFGAKGPIYKVEIDGVSVLVRQMRGSPNAYAANEENLWGGWIDPNDYVRNVKAIEKVTGCEVMLASVINQGLQTTASVDCSNKS
jgi:hypothetical protein